MERNANYALVGAVSTFLIVALIAFIAWLAGNGLNSGHDDYDIVFLGPVRGISTGSEVHFNGIKVGEVRSLTLDPQDTRYVIARARITSDVPIRTDSYAVLEPLGITGVNYVQISAGSLGKPLLKNTVGMMTVPRLGSRRDAVSDLLAGGETILERAAEVLARLDLVLSDQNIKAISGTLADVHGVTSELNAHKAIIADADKLLLTADESVKKIGDLAQSTQGLVDGEGKKSFAKLADAAVEIQAASRALRLTLDGVRAPSSQFAQDALPKLTSEIEGLQKATENLNGLLTELRSDPRAYLSKPPGKEIEVKP
jgi:phospholipid/cholesterol/gamma-HCH transport system substrate-binding protein